MAKNTETPEFKQWFRNSKVVNPDGSPKVMYNSTRGYTGAGGFGEPTPMKPNGYGLIFVTPDIEEANTFAGSSSTARIKPLYVRAENTFDGTNPEHIAKIGLDPDEIQELRLWDSAYGEDWDMIQRIKSAGFDSFFTRDAPAYGDFQNIGLFNSNQVKSIYNKGTWNMDSTSLSEAESQKRTAFDIFREAPAVKEALHQYQGKDFRSTLQDARKGDKSAFYVIVYHSLSVVEGAYNTVFPSPQEDNYYENSQVFFHQFLNWLFEGDSLLHTFTPMKAPGEHYSGPFAQFKHLLGHHCAEIAQSIHDHHKTRGVITPEEEEENLQDQHEFMSYLKTINPVYARLFGLMTKNTPLQGILDQFAWKSLQSLQSKVAVIRGLYADFIAQETSGRESSDVQ